MKEIGEEENERLRRHFHMCPRISGGKVGGEGGECYQNFWVSLHQPLPLPTAVPVVLNNFYIWKVGKVGKVFKVWKVVREGR
jgi:hypothetical protein